MRRSTRTLAVILVLKEILFYLRIETKRIPFLMALYVVFLVGVLSSPDFKAKPVSNAMWPSFINSPKQTFIQQLILHQEFTDREGSAAADANCLEFQIFFQLMDICFVLLTEDFGVLTPLSSSLAKCQD